FELSTLVTSHSGAPAVGLLEVSTLPALSIATQRVDVGQVRPSKPPPPGAAGSLVRLVRIQAAAPPVGLVEYNRPPASSRAKQTRLERHDVSTRLAAVAKRVTFQAAAPPVGLVEVNRSPPPYAPRARQRLGSG